MQPLLSVTTLALTIALVSAFFVQKQSMDAFVRINEEGTGFIRHGKRYLIRGANYWQGMNLGANACAGGNRQRLEAEVQAMASMGINNLRIMASSEGPDDQPFRMRPSLMLSPGQYNDDIAVGLDHLLDVMGRYEMTAVVTLNNFWQWSGGFAQYVAWVTGDQSIPYPEPGKPWDAFETFSARFYNDTTVAQQAQAHFKDHIAAILMRRNTVNGKVYNQDPVIMSWQLANEPQEGPAWWFEDIASYIKQYAPNQLVSVGLESKLDHFDFIRAHQSPSVDYTTCHLWVENWGIYNPSDKASIEDALAYANTFIASRAQWAADLGKPIVLEEFGMARDAWIQPNNVSFKYNPNTPTTHKDQYYKAIFDQIIALAKQDKFSGSNFWAYSGLGRSTDLPNPYGMVWLGDPPHEIRGWYGVYDKDTTISVIQTYNAELAALASNYHDIPMQKVFE